MRSERILDEISRRLAEPMPRRSLVRMLAGVFAAAGAAVFAAAAPKCKEGEKECGQLCCGKKQICVRQGDLTFCEDASRWNKVITPAATTGALAGAAVYTEAVNDRCGDGEIKCGIHCCPPGTTCVGGICCPNGNVCGDACCPAGYVCEDGHCVSQHPSES